MSFWFLVLVFLLVRIPNCTQREAEPEPPCLRNYHKLHMECFKPAEKDGKCSEKKTPLCVCVEKKWGLNTSSSRVWVKQLIGHDLKVTGIWMRTCRSWALLMNFSTWSVSEKCLRISAGEDSDVWPVRRHLRSLWAAAACAWAARSYPYDNAPSCWSPLSIQW